MESKVNQMQEIAKSLIRGRLEEASRWIESGETFGMVCGLLDEISAINSSFFTVGLFTSEEEREYREERNKLSDKNYSRI